jgi:hypothetical protein
VIRCLGAIPENKDPILALHEAAADFSNDSRAAIEKYDVSCRAAHVLGQDAFHIAGKLAVDGGLQGAGDDGPHRHHHVGMREKTCLGAAQDRGLEHCG